MKVLAGSFVLLFLCISLYSHAVDKNELNVTITINYGLIIEEEKVHIKSDAAKNAIMGGMLGAATSGDKDRDKHAAQGAAAMLLLTKLAEGKNEAHSYTVELNSGSIIKVIVEKDGLVQGDCVSVEQGRHTNIRRVSSTFCEHHGHEALSHSEIVNSSQEDADACHKARELALQAHTEKELDIAMKKVSVFCEH